MPAMTDAEAAERLYNRLAREVAAAVDRGETSRAESITREPVMAVLKRIATESR